MKNKNERVGWWIRFVFGAVAGLGGALSMWVSTDFDSKAVGVICFTVMPIAFGLMAGNYGDRFWEKLHDFF